MAAAKLPKKERTQMDKSVIPDLRVRLLNTCTDRDDELVRRLNVLMIDIGHEEASVARLTEENTRYREALEWISRMDDDSEALGAKEVASAALVKGEA